MEIKPLPHNDAPAYRPRYGLPADNKQRQNYFPPWWRKVKDFAVVFMFLFLVGLPLFCVILGNNNCHTKYSQNEAAVSENGDHNQSMLENQPTGGTKFIDNGNKDFDSLVSLIESTVNSDNHVKSEDHFETSLIIDLGCGQELIENGNEPPEIVIEAGIWTKSIFEDKSKGLGGGMF